MYPPVLLLSLAFFLSGISGLVYETMWSRYLGLFVGHTAYAQASVLILFLGGMALGALWVGKRAEVIRRPLVVYAAVELAVGVYGILFHDLYLGLEALAYRWLLPALGGTTAGTAVTWLLVGALLLPPSLLLGATFPLMSAGFLRLTPRFPGRVLASLYFLNSLGAAVGALLGGFLLLPVLGLPGSVLAAGSLNVVVALMAWGVDRRWRGSETAWGREGPGGSEAPAAEPRSGAPGTPQRLLSLLLGVSFGTALASFIYEVAWIRMLSLVLGSASHSFEIMLSAFILGLALGSFWVRRKADAWQDPVLALGWIQWLMGLSALATLPVYGASFGWTAHLLTALGRTSEGYALFSLVRYGLSMVVMFPATFLAGMTLPLITRTLLTAGVGERAVGWVYGINTLGSILGVALASLFLMPLLGLQAMLVFGATLDMVLGVLLLAWVRRKGGASGGESPVRAGEGVGGKSGIVLPIPGRRSKGVPAASTLAVATFGAVALALTAVQLDRWVLTSGVYRTGRVAGSRGEILFYQDGRTASVAVERREPGVRILSTNGKPDASLSELWLAEAQGRPREGRRPFSLDEPTQVLLPLVTLAHHPEARTAVMVGQGSGLSSHVLLGSPNLTSVVTVEIEPAVLEASRFFLPATERVFRDPRSELVVGDARSFLAGVGEPVDLIVSEPSNPWVSGVSSLFTVEFYRRVRDRLAPGGVFGQWFHLYEMDDRLVLAVLASLHQVFPDYHIYLVHAFDLLIVAAREAPLRSPDWSVLGFPGVDSDLSGIHPLKPSLMEACRFLNREGLAPLLDGWRSPNSDFYPILDLGAERARFLGSRAEEILALAQGPSPLTAGFLPAGPDGEGIVENPLPQVPPARALVLRNRLRAWGEAAVEAGDWRHDREFLAVLHRQQRAWALVRAKDPPMDWPSWIRDVSEGAGWVPGTGWRVVDPALVTEAEAAVEKWGGPPEAGAVLRSMAGLEKRDWDLVAQATERLGHALARGEEWLPSGLLLEMGVVARLRTGRVADAVLFLQNVGPRSGLDPEGVRVGLLRAHLDRSLGLR